MRETLQRFFGSRKARALVLVLIVVNGAVLGLETYPTHDANWQAGLSAVDHAILGAFCIEIVLRMVAVGSLAAWFQDPWDIFDLLVISVCFLPAVGSWAAVARILRVFRLLRATEVFPSLQSLIVTLFKSLPAFGTIAFLLALISYVYAVIGTHLFASTPLFATLDKTVLTLFQVLTLEGWDQVMATVLPTHPWAWIYFTSYILIGTYVLLNLTIAVITNNLDQENHQGDKPDDSTKMLAELQAIRAELAQLRASTPSPAPTATAERLS